MRIAYFDCFSGVSGNMCLGAILAAGIDKEKFLDGLKTMPLDGWEVVVEPVIKKGIKALQVSVKTNETQPVRHLSDIEELIRCSQLPVEVQRKSCDVFRKIAEAEAEIHGEDIEHVHFHEVGAVDAIIDIVGTVWGLYLLGVDRVVVSPLPLGRGFVTCQHGVFPVPAPATLKILEGVPVYGGPADGEVVTPTGAALMVTLAEEFDRYPEMVVENVGYGAGTNDFPWPNVLRLVIGKKLIDERWGKGDFKLLKKVSHHFDHHLKDEQHHHGHRGHKIDEQMPINVNGSNVNESEIEGEG